MYDRKVLKRRAKRHMRRHYVLLVVLCAISIFLGTEFTGVVDNAQTWYDTLTGQVTEVDAAGIQEERTFYSRILEDFIDDNVEAGRDEAAARLRELKDSTDPRSMLGRQRGILAAAMNAINSGQLTVTLGMALHSIVHSGSIAAIIMILLSAALSAAVWIFLRNLYQAVLRRAVLETRSYDALPMSHLFYLKSVRRWVRAALTLLLESVFESLWALTIVGWPIKHYSYFLVPFIVAENPDVRPREAITLSRRMMNGHKWECFKLEFSFIGWMILGFVTFGAADVLWSVPYRVTAYAEYYALLREAARASALPGAERLNDEYLFAPAPADALEARYGDIARRMDIVDEDIVVLSPFRAFLARWFGLWTASLDEKKVYSRQAGLRQQMRVGRLELEGRAYPQRLNPLWRGDAAALTGNVSYLTPLTIWSLIAVFFAFSMIGWVWEVSLHLISDGEFVNRGMLHGPWLPIYGSGVAMIAVLLYRLRRTPALEAIAVVVLCGFVEFMTSYLTEQAHGIRWWDYTGYFLNLDGRICGEGLAVFALGGMAAIYLLVPIIDSAVTRARPRVLIPICLALSLCFSADMVYSHFHPNVGRGITDYGEEIVQTQTSAPEPDAAFAGTEAETIDS